jgi:hypothetical protein
MGVLVHLFSSEVDVVMIFWIISFSKQGKILREVAHVCGGNVRIETLGVDSRCQFSSPVLFISRKKFF